MLILLMCRAAGSLSTEDIDPNTGIVVLIVFNKINVLLLQILEDFWIFLISL